MISVTFITADGDRIDARGRAAATVCSTSRRPPGMPLEGTCEGQMACSTCHVIVAPEWFDRLPPASEDEEDMLDLAAGVTRTSRLSCQIVAEPELDGLEVRIPATATTCSAVDRLTCSGRLAPVIRSASIKASLNAGMSSGLRLVMRLPSIATS